MTGMKNLSLLTRLMSSEWASLAGKRNSIASYRRPPLAVGVVILTVSAWMLGHYTAPVNTQARTVAPARDQSEELAQIERLRGQVAALVGQKERAEAKRDDTQRRLDGCRRVIRRYQEELAAVDALQATESEEGK
jgi:hypothetical protein